MDVDGETSVVEFADVLARRIDEPVEHVAIAADSIPTRDTISMRIAVAAWCVSGVGERLTECCRLLGGVGAGCR